MSGSQIFYLCEDNDRPAHAGRQAYQHVDILNQHGHRAYAVHRKPGFRFKWFGNDTRVLDHAGFTRVYQPERDYLVVPEDLGWHPVGGDGPRVIFNRNAFRGFRTLGWLGSGDPRSMNNVAAIFCLSQHNAEQLRLCHPSVPVHRIFPALDPATFAQDPPADEERTGKLPIICALRRNAPHLLAVHQGFRERAAAGLNAGKGWSWVFLDDDCDAQATAVLRQASAFVCTSVDEGLPELAIQAMAAGCLLVAYRNGPFGEIAPCYLNFQYGDLVGLLSFLERIVAEDLVRHQVWIDDGRRIAGTFDGARQTASVCQAWDQVLSRSIRAPVTEQLPAATVASPGPEGTHPTRREPWLDGIIRQALRIKPGTFVDVGMNVGQTLAKVKSIAPMNEYVGFEPNPTCCAVIKAAVSKRRIEACCIFPVGLSDRNAVVRLYSQGNLDGAASLVEGFRDRSFYSTEQFVPVFEGDGLLDMLCLPSVSTIKIDVEGAELEVLRGLEQTIAKHQPFILCEVLPVRDPSTQIGSLRISRQLVLQEFLGRQGYTMHRILPDGQLLAIPEIGVHSDLTWCEYVFVPRGQVPPGPPVFGGHRPGRCEGDVAVTTGAVE